MIEKIGHIKNPLTVIAIFAAIAEISGTTVLPFIEPNNQSIYIWFLMFFPIFLVGIFFITLNFNHKVLYAPSDYKNEDHFLRSFGTATTKEKEEKLREEVKETEGLSLKNEGTTTSTKTKPSKSEQHSTVMANVALAEKLSINRLSKELGLEFETDIRFDTSCNEKVIFDGVAMHKHKIHAVEVKLFMNKKINLSRIKAVLLKAELMVKQLDDMNTKGFVLHLMVVIDNAEINLEEVKNQLYTYTHKYKVDVKPYVVTLSDLKNEYQFSH